MLPFASSVRLVLLATCVLGVDLAAAQSRPTPTPTRPITAPLLAHEAEITALLAKMTLAEKVAMIHASSSFTAGSVPRLGVPELVMSDGPHGVRAEQGRDWKPLAKPIADAGTYLPTGNTLAATWNPALGYAFGAVLGAEANARGKDVILGPGINIIRTPLNGRNFEYGSEDPYLVSRMAVGYIRGVQDQGVAACVKHYAVNNQETNRYDIDVQLSERALREIYLPGFQAAVQEAGVFTVMGAYNKMRGQWASHNDYLLNKILKQEWGFNGAVISDWGAVHNTREALTNGLDLEMGTDLGMLPNPNYGKFFLGDTVLTLVKNGQVPEAVVDDKVRRLLRVMYATHAMGGTKRQPGAYNTKAHQATARKIAEEGIVLLKNEGNLLPLKKSGVKTVAVIGANADRPNAFGGGSSQIKALYEITPLQGLKNELGSAVTFTYAPGYKIARGQGADAQLMQQAAAAAAKADVAIFVGGWTHGYDYTKWDDNAYDAEAVDKPDMKLPFGQDALLQAVLKANPNTVVVLLGGGPVEMSAWAGQARGIVEAWYPGMEGGNALARILFGEVNPSGKLPMTFPVKLEDSPAHKIGEFPRAPRPDTLSVHYKEDIFVGYRYFDTYQVAPQFPFGHGLSYTTFTYSNLRVTPGKQNATVSFTVTNTGSRAGAEVAQVYVQPAKGAVRRPDKELKAFRKVLLQPGKSQTITLPLDSRAFQYYDEGKKQWVLTPGKFGVLVGSSSRDIRLTGAATL